MVVGESLDFWTFGLLDYWICCILFVSNVAQHLGFYSSKVY